MTQLFIAHVRAASGPRPLVTVRAASEGEAQLFLAAHYPDDVVETVVEPGEWVSDGDTGSEAGDVREHPGVAWQPPAHAGR